ncbi:MAG: hypothetical protein WB495_03935, partial [Xanthobacteraceae bacterium]
LLCEARDVPPCRRHLAEHLSLSVRLGGFGPFKAFICTVAEVLRRRHMAPHNDSLSLGLHGSEMIV